MSRKSHGLDIRNSPFVLHKQGHLAGQNNNAKNSHVLIIIYQQSYPQFLVCPWMDDSHFGRIYPPQPLNFI